MGAGEGVASESSSVQCWLSRGGTEGKGKEKQASPEKEVNELEANNLSEKEFREMVIRWLKRMEDKFDNMSKNQEEMKKNQEEMKNDIAAVKNSIESIKSRLEEAEDRISELEDKMEKNTQLQQLLETKIRKHEESLRELRDNTKQNNIRIIGVPEGKETEQGIENLLEEIITENFLDIGKKNPTQIQEAHRVPSKMNPKRPTPRHIIIKLANTNDKGSEGDVLGKMEDYQSAEETAFVVDEQHCERAIESAIGGNAYQHSKVNQWTTNVIEQTLSQLTKLGKPFKYTEWPVYYDL
ncbi:LOW QUALITY PROTEIN: hypothetical protein QTO34_013131 [Cnephaeus nilssonii]|uniref:L1 transposable element RRM domain-containing protein n=1 Tax=Cnephaeus nilssonii TaxID=3371016 RepID=A0AA40I7E6_CNENI|nr:LOW QUALITY PROTEIN: hypothetical protein QTO34_013131 [Eptesicus nilssonii]